MTLFWQQNTAHMVVKCVSLRVVCHLFIYLHHCVGYHCTGGCFVHLLSHVGAVIFCHTIYSSVPCLVNSDIASGPFMMISCMSFILRFGLTVLIPLRPLWPVFYCLLESSHNYLYNFLYYCRYYTFLCLTKICVTQ